MDAPNWTPAPDLEGPAPDIGGADSDFETLCGHFQAHGRRFAFFQAVELIQDRLDGGQEVGTHVLARDEKVFFRVAPNLAFPLTDVVGIEKRPRKGNGPDSDEVRTALPPLDMTVAFLGLHGSGTPLPSYYAEKIARYDEQGSLTRSFLDFFHNRIIGLFHRSWRKHRYYQRYRPGGKDRFSGWIFSLFGLGSETNRACTRIYWPRLLCFAGMLSTRNRSGTLLSSVIAHAFKLDSVEVQEWVRRKVPVPHGQATRLGKANCELNNSFVLGHEIPDYQGKIRICIRNLKFERFQDFLPHGKDFAPLKGLVEFMLRDQFAFDLQLGLLPREAHPLTLAADCPGRLGWSSFLGDGRFDEARDVIIKVRR